MTASMMRLILSLTIRTAELVVTMNMGEKDFEDACWHGEHSHDDKIFTSTDSRQSVTLLYAGKIAGRGVHEDHCVLVIVQNP